MKLFDKLSLLIRSKLTPERPSSDHLDYDEVPPDAPTVTYPEVTIDRATRRSTINNAQMLDEAAEGIDTTALRERILNNLSDEEIKNIALDMNIDPETLPGGKGRKIMELMALAQREGKLPLLLDLCRLAKPAVAWV